MIHFFGNVNSKVFAVQTTKELSTKNKSKLISLKYNFGTELAFLLGISTIILFKKKKYS